MVKIYRFAAVRPERSAAPAIAALPYDVVTADEARTIIAKNPISFLRVSRPDAELPALPPDHERVYMRARENFEILLRSGIMQKDDMPMMYVYRVIQGSDTFTGICCCLDVDDYRTNCIRRHEQTRYDKEEDRTRHIEATKTHNGPVVLLYRDDGVISPFINSLVSDKIMPDAEVRCDNGTRHQIFKIPDASVLKRLEEIFARVPFLYIADGHHRAKSAVNVADKAGIRKIDDDEINRFMGVLFAHDRVRIHGYSRMLTDIGHFTSGTFMSGLTQKFNVKPCHDVDGTGFSIPPRSSDPVSNHVFHMYMDGLWYECSRPVDPGATLPEVLDVAVLQKHVLEGILGITDPRGEARLQYLGGLRPISDLARLVDSGRYRLAFAMQPVGIDTILAIADANGVMPPKSTWFEPKLLSGLLVHTFG
jgi:uncharacterized protein (DUF1015 family)